MTSRYAELHAHSAFSFLDGASHPEELAAEAARLGLTALALTDHDGLYGVVRYAQAAATVGLPTVFGAELHLPAPAASGTGPIPPGTVRATRQAPNAPVLDPPTGIPDPRATHLLVLARGPQGYRNLSAAIATGHLATGAKGAAEYRLEQLGEQAEGQWLILTGCRKGAVRRELTTHGRAAARAELDRLTAIFGRRNVAVEITDAGDPRDADLCAALADLAAEARLPLVATGNIHFARPRDADLADALAAVRARSSLDDMDGWLPGGPTAHLRSAAEMLARHRRHPQAVATAADLGAECAFDLSLVAPELPPYPVPAGHTEASWLRVLVERGAGDRYGPRERERIPGAWAQLDHELDIIETLTFPGYFLIVHDLVEFCRTRGILAQGRGSAANSAVCYALGITAVEPVRNHLLFERFLAPERDGPPDIDIDIESVRREEVIQYVYERFGRRHAAQVANVISYRPRSAVRDAARALGYDVGQQDAWSKSIERWGSLRGPEPTGSVPGSAEPTNPDAVVTKIAARQARGMALWGGTDNTHDVAPAHAPPAADESGEIPDAVLDLAERFLRLPRHLGIHSGGMVMCDRPVIEVCPVEWARMEGRTVLQWDKEDCADAGLVKFDLLGLGMLTALRIAFELIAEHEGVDLALHKLPEDDPAVYDLLCAADTVGVFQVESRAQMATLPRLRPRTFYDIVVEVALIRPGPIQGGSVHPYINRRHGREPVTFLHPLLEKSLGRTLGVPLFQEQLMQMAIDVAGFSPAEADRLRRAMGSKRSVERMEALRGRLMAGMERNGVGPAAREQIYDKLKAFADFGFPESHAYSFAFLVYASAWLKVHHPAAFYAGLLAAQPMGFYSPQSLVADARRHGLTTLRPDLNASAVQATVERLPAGELRPGGALGPAARPAGARREPAPPDGHPHPDLGLAIRMGLATVRGVGVEAAERIVTARADGGPFAELRDLVRRVDLTTTQLEGLATAGATTSLGADRREALWAAGALAQEGPDTLPGVSVGVAAPTLPGMSELELAVADVWATGVSADSYPTQYVRDGLRAAGVLTVVEAVAASIAVGPSAGGPAPGGSAPAAPAPAAPAPAAPAPAAHAPAGPAPARGALRRVAVGGVVTHRQRPGTAGGVTFLSLEDETGILNVVCRPEIWRRFRTVARASAALVVRGRLERADGATNLVAEHLSPLSLQVRTTSRDFR